MLKSVFPRENTDLKIIVKTFIALGRISKFPKTKQNLMERISQNFNCLTQSDKFTSSC